MTHHSSWYYLFLCKTQPDRRKPGRYVARFPALLGLETSGQWCMTVARFCHHEDRVLPGTTCFIPAPRLRHLLSLPLLVPRPGGQMPGGDSYASGARDETPPWTPRNNNQDGFHEVNTFLPFLPSFAGCNVFTCAQRWICRTLPSEAS